MQKLCTRCSVSKPLASFNLRAASSDGRTAACADCIRATKRAQYAASPEQRAKDSARASDVKRARFEADPAYKRAFYLWGSSKKRTTPPPWVSITDFVPLCRKAIKKGDRYELDHVIPLNHPLVCGLHTPDNLRVVLKTTNQRKGNSFVL